MKRIWQMMWTSEMGRRNTEGEERCWGFRLFISLLAVFLTQGLAFGQTFQISGHVSDASGNPVVNGEVQVLDPSLIASSRM